MIKAVTLLYKRPDLTLDAFRDYYESHHRKLGEKYLSPHAVKYVRRYPILTDDDPERPQFNVIMEVWFDDFRSMENAMSAMNTPTAQAELAADEEQLFDRARTQSFVVDECESDLSGAIGRG